MAPILPIMTHPKLYLKITIDRIYDGRWGKVASVRNYQVEYARAKGLGLRIRLEGRDDFMLVEHSDLDNCFKNTKIIKSQWPRSKHKFYTLWDYTWRNDNVPYQAEFFSAAKVYALHK